MSTILTMSGTMIPSIYPIAPPFLLFANPLDEVFGVAAYCSTIFDRLSCSLVDTREVVDGQVASESGAISKSKSVGS